VGLRGGLEREKEVKKTFRRVSGLEKRPQKETFQGYGGELGVLKGVKPIGKKEGAASKGTPGKKP